MTDGHFVPSDTGSKPVVDIKDRDLITDHYKRKWILAPLPYLFLLILIVYASGKRVMFYEKGNTRM